MQIFTFLFRFDVLAGVADDNPGSLHFENVQVDNSINVSAQLTATDKGSIYAG